MWHVAAVQSVQSDLHILLYSNKMLNLFCISIVNCVLLVTTFAAYVQCVQTKCT